jgi:uncharacterized protein (DUF2267 family)
MGILSDFFGKQAPSKSPLEKFEAIKTFVQQKTEFLMNKDFDGMSPEEAANKIMYQTMDQAIREKLSEEENRKVDKANEVKNVLDTLKEEVSNGRMTEAELVTILESQEFKDYSKVE